MKFARWVFSLSAAYGFITLVPMYFTESMFNGRSPPPLTHPEFYYGFIGVALAWQVAFVLMARDPLRYRAFMPLGALEKLGWGGAVLVLFLQHRIAASMLPFGVLDLAMCALFLLAFRATRVPAADTASR